MALKESLSDMDYLRSKVVKKADMMEEKEEEEGDEEVVEDDNVHEEECQGNSVQQMDSAYESGDKESQKATASSGNKVCFKHCETFQHYFVPNV